MKTLLSLFDLTGNAAIEYEDNGWQVIQIDLGLKDLFCHPVNCADIRTLNTDWFYENVFDNCETVDGIIAAPPCTYFTQSGSRWWKQADETGKTEMNIELVYQVLRCVDLCMPDFWTLENPVGRLNKLVPELQRFGPWYYQPYQYGDPYSKKTGLWGVFNKPVPTNVVKPVQSGTSESSMDYYFRKVLKVPEWNSKRAYYRSITPEGFAKAFYLNNH